MTASAPQLRALLCTSCGAPLAAPVAGGLVTCTYCRTTAQIGRLQLDPVRLSSLGAGPALDPEARERARLTSLRAQADTYDPRSNLYAFVEAPPGLGHFDAIADEEPAKRHLLHEAFVEALRHLVASGGALEFQRRVFWLARKLSQMHTLHGGEPDPAPYLETAREHVADPGYQQLLRCELATVARARGDLAAAETLLASCDPRPGQLDLDSDYRGIASRIAIEREDWARALTLCGDSHDAIPIEPASVPLLAIHRILALERLGRRDDAAVELAWICRHTGTGFIRAWIDKRPYLAPCRDVWAHRAPAADPERPPRPRTTAPPPPEPPRPVEPVDDADDAAARHVAAERRMMGAIYVAIAVLLTTAFAVYFLTLS